MNTPALESASVLPRERHELGLVFDLATTDFSDGSGVTTSTWHTAMTTVNLEYDYGLTDQIQIGGRLSFGELAEVDDDIVVFDGTNQIIPPGERNLGLGSLILRGKWVTPTDFADLGVLAEFKIPFADEDDYLTSQTFDVGVSGLLSKTWDSWTVHLNLGFVFPFGDADLFTSGDDLDPYFHGGAAVSVQVLDPLALIAQLEFNTSAFGDISVLDAPVTVLSFGGRYRLSETLFLSGALGFGLSDESGDLILSGGLDYYF